MARRAMTSEAASHKKLSGHERERIFAELVGGEVIRGKERGKKDVIDGYHGTHSVKSGDWWQIFLYRKRRWEENTVFRAIGNVANIMIECLDAFPEKREDYKKDKHKYKIALQSPMQKLLAELNKPEILPAFLSKALFNGGEVDYFSIYRENDGCFHVFEQSDVVKALSQNLTLENSRSHAKNQYDYQKVLFKTTVNVGEIELRTDSDVHYRETKCRFNAAGIFGLLSEKIEPSEQKSSKIIVYGTAVKNFNIKSIT